MSSHNPQKPIAPALICRGNPHECGNAGMRKIMRSINNC